jgi:predicted Rossmann-fold nucleotide-binding protein
MLKKIISGGQTGADIAGLVAAIKHGIPHGGAIPKVRLTEDGVLPEKYNLQELTTKSYPKRTEKNVVDSDGTVIFSHGKLTGGSLLTWKKAVEHGKPVIHLDLETVTVEGAVDLLRGFIQENGIEILNVAGTRGSGDPEIYGKTFGVVEDCILSALSIQR